MRSLGKGVMTATLPMGRKSDLTSELRRFSIWQYCLDLIVNS